MNKGEQTTRNAPMTPLTGIRFFLALWVVVFHQAFYQGHSWTSPLPWILTQLIQSGYMAVGVFFVLSGFILSYNYSLERSWLPEQVKRFAAARLARIYPTYCLGLVLSAPWVAAVLLKSQSPVKLGKEAVKALLTWSLFQAWVPWAAEGWNGPGWSLSVEAFFYACFPLIGVALWRLSRPWHLFAGAFAIWTAAAIIPAVAVGLPLSSDAGVPAIAWTPDSSGVWVNFVKFNPLMHIPEFCMGILAARVFNLLRSKRPALLGHGYWLYVPAIVFEIAAIISAPAGMFPFLHNGLLLPFHSLLILGLALDGGILARFLSIRPLVLGGNASYSMYILQSPVAGAVFFAGKHWFSALPGGSGITFIFVLVLVAFSVSVFKMFEVPAAGFLKTKLHSWSGSPGWTTIGSLTSDSRAKAVGAG